MKTAQCLMAGGEHLLHGIGLSEEVLIVAEATDRHASDVRTLSEAWPKR